MIKAAAWANLVAGLALVALPAAGDTLLLRGKVVMEDGSPPDKAIGIEEFCQNGVRQVAVADRKGLFQWSMDIDPLRALTCLVRAQLNGYDSTAIDISGFGWSSDPNLPPLVLRRHGPGGASTDAAFFQQSSVPVSARTAWNGAAKAAQAKNWAQAERQLRSVVQTAPEFVEGWYGLGFARSQLHKPVDAQEALRQAIARNPKMLAAYLLLTGVSLEAHDWQTAREAADNLIRALIGQPQNVVNRGVLARR